jgi:very-short-patch-repair endonuclease
MFQFLKANFSECRFRRQHPVDKYVLDFYSPKYQVCVELDGSQHVRRELDDEARDRFLASLGILTIRIAVDDFIRDPKTVKLHIESKLELRPSRR